MGFIRRFLKEYDRSHVKIYHKVHHDFHTIGEVLKENSDLNIAKIKFIDVKGKEKSYWFHLFTGMVVTLPKKKGEFATDVPNNSEKAYALSIEPVYLYDLDPTADINYKPKEETVESQEKDPESNPNEKIEKIQ